MDSSLAVFKSGEVVAEYTCGSISKPRLQALCTAISTGALSGQYLSFYADTIFEHGSFVFYYAGQWRFYHSALEKVLPWCWQKEPVELIDDGLTLDEVYSSFVLESSSDWPEEIVGFLESTPEGVNPVDSIEIADDSLIAKDIDSLEEIYTSIALLELAAAKLEAGLKTAFSQSFDGDRVLLEKMSPKMKWRLFND